VAMPVGANIQDAAEAVFTSPVLFGGNDFGWWEYLEWDTSTPPNTETVVGVRFGDSTVSAQQAEWTNFLSTNGNHEMQLDKIGYGLRYMQMRVVLKTTVSGIGSSMSNLRAVYRTKRSALFFTKKFVLQKASDLSSGILTALTVTPSLTEIRFGITDDGSADWDSYQIIDADKAFGRTNGNRIKVGIKLIQYSTEIPEVDGFAFMVGGKLLTKVNQA